MPLVVTHPVPYHFDVRSGPDGISIPAWVESPAIAEWNFGEHSKPQIITPPHAASTPDELLAALLGIHAWHYLQDEPRALNGAKLNASVLREAWLGADVPKDLRDAIQRLRSANLNWVSVACLQPGLPLAYSGFGAEWLDARLRKLHGSGLRSATTAAHALRSAIHAHTAEAIASALRVGLSDDTGAAESRISIPVHVSAAPSVITVTAHGAIIAHENQSHAALEAVAGGSSDAPIEAAAHLENPRAFLNFAGIQTDTVAGERLRLSLTLTEAQMSCWCALPRERSAAYFPVVSHLSVRVQDAMRRWVGALLLSNAAKLENLQEGPACVLYSASAPFRPRNRAAYSYDVLDADHVRMLYRSAQTPMRESLLPRIESFLQDAGRSTLARSYTPRRIGHLLEPVNGAVPRSLASLVGAEAVLIDDLVRIATHASDSVSRESFNRRVRSAPKAIVKAIQQALRRAVKGSAAEWLTPLIYAEATLALAEALNRDASCRLTINLSGTITFAYREPQGLAAGTDKACAGEFLESTGIDYRPQQADDGDDCGGVRSQSSRRRESRPRVQSPGGSGERIRHESDCGPARHARVTGPCPWQILRRQPAGVEGQRREPGTGLPDQFAA